MDAEKFGYQYYRQVFSKTSKPFAFIDLDLFDANAAALKQRAGNKAIRIASKSIRCQMLMSRLLASDPQFQGVMSFHPEEATYLSRQGFDDILLGYPIYDKRYIRAIAEHVSEGKKIIFMVDDVNQLEQINRVGAALEVELPVCLDIDMSSRYPFLHFGVLRSRLQKTEDVLSIYQAIEKSRYVFLDGIMGYEAQIAGLADNVPGQFLKSQVIRFLKSRSCKEVADRRARIIGALAEHGATPRFINGGGTGSLETTASEDVVTEVAVGSGFFSSALFDHYRQFKHHPAAGFAVEIVRKSSDGIFTCLGGGYVASGQPGKDRLPQPYLPESFQLTTNEAAGEVQTPIIYHGKESLDFGDPVFFRHSKAGELCERFNQLHLVREGKLVGEVPTYRGEGLCFI
ncbi:amino acid deaminase/aldolase [Veronia pacifica]|uniref:Amino acid aldolase n=1 Tax=Veronia pacifica TaxID=1080227 RepID=A0A1C3E9J8_9GAMM|nr:amino acid deaminase/aldolase [Veronia pacifica]ODA29912.1 amino acid aldolase [Veronia pacifica]